MDIGNKFFFTYVDIVYVCVWGNSIDELPPKSWFPFCWQKIDNSYK
jgi:hypothetical protein